MKFYCHIENNAVIDGPRTLPESIENVSNFHCLDDKTLISYGWLPYEKSSENKEVVVSSSFEILEDKVIEHVITRDKLEVEIKQEEATKLAQEWALIRTRRDALLADSDKKVVIDKWMALSEEVKALYVDYRKKLRDIPQDFAKPSDVVFPDTPVENSTNNTTVV